MKPKSKAAVASKPAPAVKAVLTKSPKVASIILRNQVDTHVGYIAGRFPSTVYGVKLQKLSVDMKKIETPAKGFLVTKGPKGCLINEVASNPTTGFYSRKSGETELFGHVGSLSEIPDIEAKVYSSEELVHQTLKRPTVKRFAHRDTKEEVDVALFNPDKESYFVGVTLNASGNLRVLNMEPQAKYNTKAVQWSPVRDITDGKLVAQLLNYGKKTAKAVLRSK